MTPNHTKQNQNLFVLLRVVSWFYPFSLENKTIKKTAGNLGKAAFAIYIIVFSFVVVSAQESELKIITETQKITGEELKSLAKPTDKKPVLINFWATWCGPCRAEFPDLVEIDADYRAKGLNFFIVSVDDFAVIDTRVPEFLKDYNSTMPSYLIDIEERKEIAKAVRRIAPRFADVYPLTLLFNGSGKLVFQKSGKVDAKILRAQIDKVLPKTNKLPRSKLTGY